MAILGRFKGKRNDDDEDDDGLDEPDEESEDDDDGPSTGLFGRMRRKLTGSNDDSNDDDDGPDASPDDGGGSSGMFGRMRQKFKRGNDDEDEDDELGLASGGLGGGGDTAAVPVTVTSPPSDAPVAAGDGDDQPAPAQEGSPTAVYIVDGPDDGGAPPEAAGTAEGEDAQKQDTAANDGSAGGGSGLDLSGIFETEKVVDEAFQDLVASAGEVTASDLATQLQELMSSLDKGG